VSSTSRPVSSGPERTGILAGMDARTVLVLNGPNLNLLGEREPEIYGSATLSDVEGICSAACGTAGLELDFRQTNHEGVLVDWVQEGRADSAGIVINAAGYTHTSVALRDALAACRVPRVEVHISDIAAREPFRRFSYLTDVCDHHVIGRGVQGYAEAIAWLAASRREPAGGGQGR
jgi:3-dehydroquinate dehydratase II